MDLNYLIVGAGYSGLLLGRELHRHPGQIAILEKSKGVGGRLATRRDGAFTFDHGAQFIRKSSQTAPLIENWQSMGISSPLLDETFCAIGGMTRIAKDLAKDLNIEFERKVLKLTPFEKKWAVQDDKGQSWVSSNVVLSCPLPQTIEILKNSGLSYDEDLEKVIYAKAIVFLIKDNHTEAPRAIYREPSSSEVFSVCSQLHKGTSSLPAWTVTMNASWSETHFDLSEDEIISAARKHLADELPPVSLNKISVKKWRYSHPLSSYSKLFTEVASGLYLIGDAFGGSSINGAHRSSEALLKHLQRL